MEDILRKDIFKEKDLCKLSPDYAPSEVLLRMEMRRTMIQNTHSHGPVNTASWQRRPLRKSDKQVMNREIVNIQHNFHKNNLRNKVILKRDINFNKFQYSGDSDLLLNDLEDIADLYLPQIINHDELVVCNNDEFRLNLKSKRDCVEKKTVKGKQKPIIIDNDLNTSTDDCYNDSELIRIECKYITPRNEDFDNIQFEININNDEDNIIAKYDTETLRTPIVNPIKENIPSLLVMMALSSEDAKNDDQMKLSPKYSDIKIDNGRIDVGSHNTHVDVNVQTESENMRNVLNITPLRVYIGERQMELLRKYANKWKSYVNNRTKSIAQHRQAALDNFFEKLSKRKLDSNQLESVQKAKSLARDYSTYQHRYKIQKHIIALQKAKLEEQNRLIEELKYNKIIEASKQSVDDMREQIRKTYYEIDRQLKPKIKCLTNELKIPDIEEPALVLHCLKVPQFLQRMEKRAREREEKHAMIRERRRQLEEERIRIKQQTELAKAEMDKEEKMKRIIELREKRKRERIEAIRKKQHADRIRGLIVMADLHYERYLMNKYGIRPFRKLLQKRRDNMEKAKTHFTFQLKKNVFLNWMWYTEDMWFERNYKADDFHRKKILRKAFDAWKQAQLTYIHKKQVAEDYYDFYVTQLVFRHFRRGIEVVKKENELKFQKAVLYYNGNLLFKILTCWRTLPALNALKREQEARKARWREKVLQVVPDFVPPED